MSKSIRDNPSHTETKAKGKAVPPRAVLNRFCIGLINAIKKLSFLLTRTSLIGVVNHEMKKIGTVGTARKTYAQKCNRGHSQRMSG